MAVRGSMQSLIAKIRGMINDPSGPNESFHDQDIQEVLDDRPRLDIVNELLTYKPTYVASTISFLDYYHPFGNWESDVVLKQYLVTVVTPSVTELTAGHFQFATSTLPPIYITGKTYDLYRAAADLLERLAAQWALSYSINVDGQSLNRSQVAPELLRIAKTYRMKQRSGTIGTIRSDLRQGHTGGGAHGLGANDLDYFADGIKGGP